MKGYLASRRVVTRSNKAKVSSDDLMFFTLFGHIQRNHVEMTAPVINTFVDVQAHGPSAPGTRPTASSR